MIIHDRNNINALVLKAKAGNRDSLKRLWELYQDLIQQIINGFIINCTNLFPYKHDMYQLSYMYFVRIVGEFSFTKDIYFGYFLKRQIVDRLYEKLRNKEWILEDIDPDIVMDHSGDFNNIHRNKIKKLRIVMKKLTSKQLQAVSLYHFGEMTQSEAAKIVGISQIGLRKRLNQSYTKINKLLRRMKEHELKKNSSRKKRIRVSKHS